MSGQKITEKYEYLTEIITAYDGTEQRIKLRQYPRHFLTYDYSAMNKFDAQYLRGIMRMRQSDKYYIPMWQDVVYLREDFVANGKALYIDRDYTYNLNECEWIEIFVRDDIEQTGINLVRQLEGHLDGVIRLKKKISRPLDMHNTWIYPLRQCSTQTTQGLSYVYSNGSEVGINYEDLLIPSKIHIPSKYRYEYYSVPYKNMWNLPTEYNNKELFDKRPEWIDDSSVQLSVDKNVVRLDNTTGTFVYDLINTKSSDIHTYQFSFKSQAEINNIKIFFHRICGKYKSFYMPTWVNDFEVAKDISSNDSFIYTEYSNLYQFYASNARQKALVIFKKDWTCHIIEINTYTFETMITPDGEQTHGKILIFGTAKQNINKNDILMCSYLNLVRLDSDELQLNYESNIVATTTFVVKEIDK